MLFSSASPTSVLARSLWYSDTQGEVGGEPFVGVPCREVRLLGLLVTLHPGEQVAQVGTTAGQELAVVGPGRVLVRELLEDGDGGAEGLLRLRPPLRLGVQGAEVAEVLGQVAAVVGLAGELVGQLLEESLLR